MGTVFSKGEVENAGEAFAKTVLGEVPPSLDGASRAERGSDHGGADHGPPLVAQR